MEIFLSRQDHDDCECSRREGAADACKATRKLKRDAATHDNDQDDDSNNLHKLVTVFARVMIILLTSAFELFWLLCTTHRTTDHSSRLCPSAGLRPLCLQVAAE